ncbi:hypothetical protein ACHAXT_008280 [Thalassiosira profunda]
MSADASKPRGSLPPCAVCRAATAVYRCPRCQTQTCSLACCRAHKEGQGSAEGAKCSGKRDRTEFCSLAKFSDARMASDYHFLEDVLKVSEGSRRLYHGLVSGGDGASAGAAVKRARSNGHHSSKVKLDSISNAPPDHPLLTAKKGKSAVEVLAHGVDDPRETNDKQSSCPSNGIVNQLLDIKQPAKPTPQRKGNVDHLVRQAELKGVNLLRMPNGMERRRSNTTKFNKKKGNITWKVELCFHSPKDTVDEKKEAELGEASVQTPMMLKVESEVSESSTLLGELGKHLDVHPGNATTRSQLRSFASVPRESLLLFMKRLPCSSAAPQYYRLDPGATLMESLRGKAVIEFPTIDVATEADQGRFPLFIGEV